MGEKEKEREESTPLYTLVIACKNANALKDAKS